MQLIDESQILKDKVKDIDDIFFRTEQIWITDKYRCKILSHYCHISKNLRNEANFNIRYELKNNGKYIKYGYINELMRIASENYRELPIHTSQQTLRMLDSEWQSYFRAKEEFEKNPEKFLGRPRWPGYLKKDGEFILKFDNNQIRIVDGYLIFPKNFTAMGKIKTRLKKTNPREVRIVPKGTGYIIEIVYLKDKEKIDLDKNKIIGIDLGVRNIVTIVNNIGEIPIVVKGDILKSINQWYNKRKAELQAIYTRQIKDKKNRYTGQIQILIDDRYKKVKDILHKISRYIVNLCIKYGIGTIVIGYSEKWKQYVEIGRKNNQNFVSIPHHILIKDIEYKAEEIGIDVVKIEESYTSKCSFLDDEEIRRHKDKEYRGNRISRGLFRSLKGIIINADVNAAYNIIRKVFQKAFSKEIVDRIVGNGLHPKRLSILDIL